jgi:hypothetical protein
MNKLLSEEYRRVLETEHTSSDWGVVGWKQAPSVYELVEREHILTLLDYGAGRGSLGHWFDQHAPNQLDLREYEPGIVSRSADPDPAELVTCIDVMEHVEPDCVVAVLDHIQELAQRWVYFNISLRPAVRILSDGRNAHLTIESIEWWQQQLQARWQEASLTLNQKNNSFNWLGSVRA